MAIKDNNEELDGEGRAGPGRARTSLPPRFVRSRDGARSPLMLWQQSFDAAPRFSFKQKITNMNSFSVGEEDLTWVMELLNKWMSPNNYLNSFTDYSAYLFWVLVPFVLLFSPVLMILGFIYLSNLLLHIYKRKVNLKEDYLSKSWDNGRRAVAHLWDMYGTVWHGYEVHGMDKVPEGPGLIVFYHGAFPLDYYYFVSRLYLRTGRFCRSVVDYHFSKIP
ncbi:transmembrane protein 68-like, partial [Python bivittatus]|uniref:Transmembrane protein 68-like n=1 Tax=Python bivittatus TaxID=176946 RepID=A0A9F5N6W3_PYTBI